MHPWLSTWGEKTQVVDLRIPLAAGFVGYLARSGDGVAEVLGARCRDDAEVIVLNVRTGRPQRPAYPLRRVEALAVFFTTGDAPRILALREDFPDTPHQSLLPPGLPFGLCIDDRPWPEARSTYTPAELLERIVTWFRKAGRGELHDATQPLDPLFVGIGLEVVLPRSAWMSDAAELVGFIPPDTERPRHIIAKPLADVPDGSAKPGARLVVLAYDLAAQPMTRLRFAPNSLGSLHAEMSRRGLELVEDLTLRIAKWHAAEDNGRGRLHSRLLLLFRIPIIHPATGVTGATSTIAFATRETIGQVGEALGLLLANDGHGKELMPFVKSLVTPTPMAGEIALGMALVHAEFDAQLAATLSGRRAPDLRAVAMIGAGAIGASVAESLVREGDFASWTIVDHDTFLPHNEARHTLIAADVGRSKAMAVARRLAAIRPDLSTTAIDADFLDERDEAAAKACEEASVVIDASASVPVARRLSDLPGAARRLSIFFNPSGTAAVMLAEDAVRSCDLRSLESVYHREVQLNADLADHLSETAMLPYTGACRSLTSRIPASQVQALSGIVAHAIRRALDESDALVRIWTMSADGSVTVATPPPRSTRYAVCDWTVVVPCDLERSLAGQRADHLPCETGGALLGLIDIEARRIDVVDALSAPPDSIGTPESFVRGIDGLRPVVEIVIARSMGQIRYVGEWHSHPDGSSTRPSLIDIEQIAWLAGTLSQDGFPGLMLIIAEDSTNPIIGEVVDDAR